MNELQIFIFGGVVLVSLSAVVLCKLFICNSDSDNRSRRFKRPKFFKHRSGSISGNYENEVDENYEGMGCNDPDLERDCEGGEDTRGCDKDNKDDPGGGNDENDCGGGDDGGECDGDDDGDCGGGDDDGCCDDGGGEGE